DFAGDISDGPASANGAIVPAGGVQSVGLTRPPTDNAGGRGHTSVRRRPGGQAPAQDVMVLPGCAGPASETDPPVSIKIDRSGNRLPKRIRKHLDTIDTDRQCGPVETDTCGMDR